MSTDEIAKQESLAHFLLIDRGAFRGIAEKNRNLTLREIIRIHGSLGDAVEKLAETAALGSLAGANDFYLNKIKEQLGQIDFSVLTFNDEEFPGSLKDNRDAPPILYAIGDLGLLKADRSIAVVGRGSLDDITESEIRTVVDGFISDGYLIISDIETPAGIYAQEYLAEMKGRGIVILNAPLNRVLAGQREIYKQAQENGLVISPYPIGRGPSTSYMNTNILMTTLSTSGIVIFDVKGNKGTKDAIRRCVDQGKNVYTPSTGDRYVWTLKHASPIPLPELERDAV